jgi:group I intron endonuclease
MKTGIYNIRNIINNDIYIGSASNLKNRWNVHRHKLSNNKHVNIHLQRAFNKYGSENFIFEVIEYVDKSNLIIREQNWIDFFQPEYNIRKVAHNNTGVKWSTESRKKASDRMKNKEPWNKNKKGVSEETRIKMKDAWLRRRENGTDTPMLGKKHNNLSIEKISGENNGSSKLKESDILLIRSYWDKKECKQIELAKIFDVRVGCIFKIVNRLSWKHI